MAETEIYTYEDIQRYLQRKMSEQEMHQFERALMNDPFLADALEGFSAGNESVSRQHLDEIERSLTPDKQKAKVVALPPQRTGWWKIAVVAITIVFTGLLTYSVINKQNTSVNEVSLAAPAKRQTPLNDTFRHTAPPLATVDAKPEKQAIIVKRQGRSTVKATPVDGNHPMREIALASAPATDTLTAGYRSAKTSTGTGKANGDLAANQSMTALPGRNDETSDLERKMVSRSGAEMKARSMVAPKNIMNTNTDTSGLLNAGVGDGRARETANVAGPFVTGSRVAMKKEEMRNKSPEDSMTLAEVVVSTISKRKNRVATIHADSSVSAEPILGWKNFQQYFGRQLDSLKSADPAIFDQDITVEFSVGAFGKPTAITTEGGYDPTSMEKVKRALSEGPLWHARKKGRKVKIIISF